MCCAWVLHATFSLFRKKERVKYDRFGEGNGQDGLDKNLRGGFGIASHGFRSFHADQTHSDGSAKRCQTHCKVSRHIAIVPFLAAHTVELDEAAEIRC